MQNRLYYTAMEVQEILGVSRGKAYKVISALNAELDQKGFLTIPGKISRKFLEEKVYGMQK